MPQGVEWKYPVFIEFAQATQLHHWALRETQHPIERLTEVHVVRATQVFSVVGLLLRAKVDPHEGVIDQRLR